MARAPFSATVIAGVLGWSEVAQSLGAGGASALPVVGGWGGAGEGGRLLQELLAYRWGTEVSGGGTGPGYKASWCLQEPTDLGRT